MQRPKKAKLYEILHESIEYSYELKWSFIFTIFIAIILVLLFIRDHLYIVSIFDMFLEKPQIVDNDIKVIKSMVLDTMLRWFYISISIPLTLFVLINITAIIWQIYERNKIFSIVKKRILEKLNYDYEYESIDS